jgi:phosphohistidine phosphatase
MRIYLVRHGKASKDMTLYKTDEERPLTKRGNADVERIAVQLAKAAIEVHQIRHSGVLRARETADILGKHLSPPGGVIAVEGLHWDDPVEPLAQTLPLETGPIMLVGHNPFMEQLASRLLTGSFDRVPVTLSTSGTACLEYANGAWSLRWLLSPEIMPED